MLLVNDFGAPGVARQVRLFLRGGGGGEVFRRGSPFNHAQFTRGGRSCCFSRCGEEEEEEGAEQGDPGRRRGGGARGGGGYDASGGLGDVGSDSEWAARAAEIRHQA